MSYLDTEIMLSHSQEPAPSAKWDPCLGATGAEKVLSVAYPGSGRSDVVLDRLATALPKAGAVPPQVDMPATVYSPRVWHLGATSPHCTRSPKATQLGRVGFTPTLVCCGDQCAEKA